MSGSSILKDWKFVRCLHYGTIGEDIRASVVIVTTGMSNNYDGIKTSIINWKEGVVDSMLIRLSDAWAGSWSATRILRTALYLKYGKMAGKWNGMFISRQKMITGN